MSLQFTNISTYKFADLTNLKELRAELVEFCKQHSIKGTILLAPEGINLFAAASQEAIDDLMGYLRKVPGLSELTPKVSYSDHQPFNRMLVRLKKEIIAFGVEGIDPARSTAPRLEAKELKKWLDEKRPLVLLDTRNEYEIKLGTFKNATAIGVDRFRDFPAALKELPAEMKEATVVSFCTGGIRCEKAAALMQREGYNDVYQLEGGILKYFEEVGSDHYDGDCFVFDARVGVDPGLSETDSAVCFACLAPLTSQEQADPRYLKGISCPSCYREKVIDPQEVVRRQQERLYSASNPLPGSIPANNVRPLRIPGRLDGAILKNALAEMFPQVPSNEWETLCQEGRLLNNAGENAQLEQEVRGGQYFQRLDLCEIEPDINANIEILYLDDSIVVLNKPAPLPMHACGRFNRNTLRHILQTAWEPKSPRPAHRLDANTSGVLVCALTHHIAKLLQPQFANGQVQKLYQAVVQGQPSQDQFSCNDSIAAQAGESGLRETDEEGLECLTHFRVLERRPDGTSLVECQPITGRTNQIRIHLWQLGFPIVGDPSYLLGQQRGQRQTLEPNEPPMKLHSYKIQFIHPTTKETVEFSCKPPW